MLAVTSIFSLMYNAKRSSQVSWRSTLTSCQVHEQPLSNIRSVVREESLPCDVISISSLVRHTFLRRSLHPMSFVAEFTFPAMHQLASFPSLPLLREQEKTWVSPSEKISYRVCRPRASISCAGLLLCEPHSSQQELGCAATAES